MVEQVRSTKVQKSSKVNGSNRYINEGINSDNAKSKQSTIPFKYEFHSDLWEIGHFFEKEGKTSTVYDFSQLDNVIKVHIKRFIHRQLTREDSGYATIDKYKGICKMISQFISDEHIMASYLITTKHIEKFNRLLERRLKSEMERIKRRTIFAKLLVSIEEMEDVDYSSHLKLLDCGDIRLVREQIEEGKTPRIEKSLFDKILSVAIKELNDEKAKYKHRLEACAIVLFSQIGVRIEELIRFEMNMILPIELEDGRKMNFLDHLVVKIKKSKSYSWTNSMLTPHAYNAYETACYLVDMHRRNHKGEYLFSTSGEKPLTDTAMRNWMSRFYVRHVDELGLKNAEVEGAKYSSKGLLRRNRIVEEKFVRGLSDTDFIAMPKAHQYRVSVVNDLLDQGIDLIWVSLHLNHLTVDMTDHYVRRVCEENRKKRKLFEELIKKETTFYGDEIDSLYEELDEFVKANKFSIEKDLEAIITKLQGEFIIVPYDFGFCIERIYGRPCRYNRVRTKSDVYSGRLSNVMFIDLTLGAFRDKCKTIEYNLKYGFTKEADRTRINNVALIEKFLNKEIEDMGRLIKEKGEEKTIDKYPHLKKIVENFNTIKTEVTEWMNQNESNSLLTT